MNRLGSGKVQSRYWSRPMSMPRVPSTVMPSGPPSGSVVSFSILSASNEGFLGKLTVDKSAGRGEVHFSGRSCGVESRGPVAAAGARRGAALIAFRLRQPDAFGDAGPHAFRSFRCPEAASADQDGDADGPCRQIVRHRYRWVRDGAEHPARPPGAERKPGQRIGTVAPGTDLQCRQPVLVGRFVNPGLGGYQPGNPVLRDVAQNGANA